MWVLGITLLGLIKRSSASVREDLFAVGGVAAAAVSAIGIILAVAEVVGMLCFLRYRWLHYCI